jgi:DNase/tRNase domain of colicin-like bacteriocin
MDFLKKTGKFAGTLTGKVLGGSVRIVGELANSKYIKEIGDSVERATTQTGELLGQTASGLYDVGAGLITKDESKRDEGLGDIGGAVKTTAIGIGHGVVHVVASGKDVYQGLKDGDNERLKQGAKNLGKVAAVGVIAIGVIDLVDGVDAAAASPVVEPPDMDMDMVQADTQAVQTDMPNTYEAPIPQPEAQSDAGSSSFASDVNPAVHPIDTINDHLAGSVHDESGVPYEEKVVHLPNGETIEGVFPDFDETYAGQLPDDMLLSSDYVQFDYMNEQLTASIANDPSLMSAFTDEQLSQIAAGETPDGYVWHHSEEPGRMELVDEQTHDEARHTGGRSLWGGGSEYR